METWTNGTRFTTSPANWMVTERQVRPSRRPRFCEVKSYVQVSAPRRQLAHRLAISQDHRRRRSHEYGSQQHPHRQFFPDAQGAASKSADQPIFAKFGHPVEFEDRRGDAPAATDPAGRCYLLDERLGPKVEASPRISQLEVYRSRLVPASAGT